MRLRSGVVLWLLSWLPYGLILGLHGPALTLAWAFEIGLGLLGLLLAGSAFGSTVKLVGWRRAPSLAWTSLRTGHAPEVGSS